MYTGSTGTPAGVGKGIVRGGREARAGADADIVRGAIEACRLEAREPAGVRLWSGGNAVRAEKVSYFNGGSAFPGSGSPALLSTIAIIE